jgi:hypothetical protein
MTINVGSDNAIIKVLLKKLPMHSSHGPNTKGGIIKNITLELSKTGMYIITVLVY